MNDFPFNNDDDDEGSLTEYLLKLIVAQVDDDHHQDHSDDHDVSLQEYCSSFSPTTAQSSWSKVIGNLIETRSKLKQEIHSNSFDLAGMTHSNYDQSSSRLSP